MHQARPGSPGPSPIAARANPPASPGLSRPPAQRRSGPAFPIAKVTIALAALLAACTPAARAPRGIMNPGEWERALLDRGVEPSTISNPLATTDKLREAARRFAGEGPPPARLERLQSSLFEWSDPAFRYESQETLTAIEAFERRSGNCLSFTNLFIAMARSVGLMVKGADIEVPSESLKEGDLVLVNAHVAAAYRQGPLTMIYDFGHTREQPATVIRLLDDLRITAIFANNRGIEDLRSGRNESAMRYLEIAVRLAPDFADAHGNLGVARRRAGDTPGALAAYRRSLEVEPRNPVVLQNLAALDQALGMEREARAAVAAAARLPSAPTVLIVLGDLAAAQNDYGKALVLYKRAHRHDPRSPEALVAIARMERTLGRFQKARKTARRALALAPDNDEARRLAEPPDKPRPH